MSAIKDILIETTEPLKDKVDEIRRDLASISDKIDELIEAYNKADEYLQKTLGGEEDEVFCDEEYDGYYSILTDLKYLIDKEL